MRFWLATAFTDPEHLVPIAVAAEACGYEGVTVSDHLFFPREMRSAYPYSADGAPPFTDTTPWPDPWVAIGAMAAATSTLRFTTNVYVAPLRDVFTVAKAVSTTAVLSGGRVALGAAAGWCREEFDATGRDFATRGARLDEMIPALRALWSGDWAEFHGSHVDFEPLRLSPAPRDPVPILIGGESPAALRRAATFGDGWIANGLTPQDAEQRLAALRAARADAAWARDTGGRTVVGRHDVGAAFEILVPLMARADAGLYERMETLGVTGVIVAPRPAATNGGRDIPLESRIAAIERLAETLSSLS